MLLFRWSSWYLHGWCRERGDWRLFKLNRMLEVDLLEETFSPRPAPSPITPAERVYPDRLRAVIRFSPEVRWRLVEDYGAESFTREADGSLLFRRGFPGKAELRGWVLTFGDQAEILEPAELRGEMAEFAKKIWEKYDR